ncbi:MAG: DUF2793 domain-containing protein [Alcanivorax sediminis]|uniref:DUF2793 domain-containing protein n=1 Tax=Alcanivorax sediminis TaxID=2663008 RepID=UPI003C380A7D
MPSITIPGTSITYGWQEREKGWGPGMNTNLIVLGQVARGVVASRSETAPPAVPAEGDSYIVAASATGAWAGEDNKQAVYLSAAWVFIEPLGMPVYVEDEGIHVYWTGAGYSGLTGLGDVYGPASSTDGEVPRFDALTGKQLQGSSLRVDDSGNLSGHGAAIKEVSGTTYTILESDCGKILHFTNSSGCTVDVPGSEIPYASNIQVVIVQKGIGAVTVQETLGSVIRSEGGLLSTAGQYKAMTLYKENSTDWMLLGERA